MMKINSFLVPFLLFLILYLGIKNIPYLIESKAVIQIPIKENGFLQLSDKKINNYKDGEEIYGTLSAIISSLFDIPTMIYARGTRIKTVEIKEIHIGFHVSPAPLMIPERH